MRKRANCEGGDELCRRVESPVTSDVGPLAVRVGPTTRLLCWQLVLGTRQTAPRLRAIGESESESEGSSGVICRSMYRPAADCHCVTSGIQRSVSCPFLNTTPIKHSNFHLYADGLAF